MLGDSALSFILQELHIAWYTRTFFCLLLFYACFQCPAAYAFAYIVKCHCVGVTTPTVRGCQVTWAGHA
jgi:hypothetical protein